MVPVIRLLLVGIALLVCTASICGCSSKGARTHVEVGPRIARGFHTAENSGVYLYLYGGHSGSCVSLRSGMRRVLVLKLGADGSRASGETSEIQGYSFWQGVHRSGITPVSSGSVHYESHGSDLLVSGQVTVRSERGVEESITFKRVRSRIVVGVFDMLFSLQTDMPVVREWIGELAGCPGHAEGMD